ncbi:hypothetical protein G6F57_007181 [Rhizopus arrhizus]|uniref:PH domain-containing protein n=1 Tax=Rhizopus oryzae TaxID=64495 RepID=A0A9P7BRU3_RHIOR|nr:hypothetical protein G6F23_002311 [Rhizopus arrhizus]KAG1422626.1 hypothetical protein G6F58_003189 [Rhizopus delemar]KAG0762568.1 hypothetical protein G6F24_006708 [Rhizopus arrhizus]KAG0788896.1 hypothetical protein G6F21_006891 [Rhizopus arrhizus]KAG0800734.1 hypothetical protein G6F22_001941 [Rhizopus arrhizus]
MSDSMPPPRPTKSKLRTPSSERSSPPQSSNTSVATPSSSPSIIDNQDGYFPLQPPSLTEDKVENQPIVAAPPVQSVAEQPKYKSRFTEHFDITDKSLIEDEFAEILMPQLSSLPSTPSVYQQKQKAEFIKESRSFSAIPSASFNLNNSAQKKKNVLIKSFSTTTVNMVGIKNNSNVTPKLPYSSSFDSAANPHIAPSISTPLQTNMTVTSPKIMDNSRFTFFADTSQATPVHSQSSFSDRSLSTSTSMIATKLNRADVIIHRLENWYIFLKSITSWVEEVAKINQQSGRGYAQKANVCLDINVSQETINENAQSNAIKSIHAQFKLLNTKLAAEQQELSKSLSHHYLPNLHKLRKECKEKIQTLKADNTLSMEELYRRAEVTRGKMNFLDRCCKQVDKMKGQVDMDPWLANLYVLRQLKREIDEENRLRLLMVPIQKDIKEFEARIIEIAKPTIKFCCKRLLPGAYGDDTKEPLSTVINQIAPDYEWDLFFESHKKELVNEKYPVKDYTKINYPNKFNPLVMTLLKGKMERKSGVRKQFIERFYVLSQAGYLHQFTMDNKVSPEKTIYIPSTTIIPYMDLSNQATDDLYQHYNEEEKLEKSHTFEICKRGANVLQREKVSTFRTSTREELVAWCTQMMHISTTRSKIDQQNNPVDYSNSLQNSSLIVDNMESQVSGLSDSRISTNTATRIREPNMLSIDVAENAEFKINNPSSPTQSVWSNKSDESFNEPALLSRNGIRKLSFPFNPFKQYPSITSPIQEQMNIKANSSIKADTSKVLANNRKTSIHSADTKSDKNTDIESFSADNTQDKDDSISISSSCTEKGQIMQSEEVNQSNSMVPLLDERSNAYQQPQNNGRKSPSIVSTVFDDAQSSLYFSSTSSPPSPASSSHSSIISIPDLQLIEQEGTIAETTNWSRNSNIEVYNSALMLNLDHE